MRVKNALRAPARFRLFWTARVLSSLAYQVAAVAIGWYVYDRTRSAYCLGLLGLCQFVPMVLLTFVAGNTADRADRRKIVIVCQILEFAILGGMGIAETARQLSVPAVFASLTLVGAARAFEGPTLASLLPGLVETDELPHALAVSSSAGQTATIVGPSVGGLLYAGGVRAPLCASSLLFLAACLSIAMLRARQSMPNREPMTLRSAFSGLSFVWGRSVLLGVVSLDLFAVLLGGVTALLPIFARDILRTGPWGLGMLRSAPAVGALLMSAILSRRSLGGQIGLKMFAAVIAFGIATIVFSASSNLALSVASLLVLGASDNISVVIRSSLVQLSTPDEMRGRVNAVNSLFVGTSNQLGEFESGMTAGLLGPVGAGILGGVGTILVALVWMRRFPKLRALLELKDVQPAVLSRKPD